MLKNTSQLKRQLERSLVAGTPFGHVKSDDAGPRAGVIRVVAQESIVGFLHARAKKKESADRRES